MKTGLLDPMKASSGEMQWKQHFVFLDIESWGIVPRLDVHKEAFNGDEKYMFPFPFWKDLLVMLRITIRTSYIGNLTWGESMPIFNQGMATASLALYFPFCEDT